MMAASVVSQSLQRTNSNNDLNVYIVVQNKIKDEFLIISRERLPPTLRNGKLTLNQKVTFRNEHRNNVEGVIVYMDFNRNNCVLAKKELIEKRKLQQNKDKENTRSDVSTVSASSISIPAADNTNKSLEKLVKKTSNLQKKKKNKEVDKHSSVSPSDPPSNDLDEDEANDVHTAVSTEYSSSSIGATLTQQEKINEIIDDEMESLSSSDIGQKFYVDKIEELSTKVKQLEQTVKEKNAEIKRLKSTTIEMPSDPATQQYICRLSDKVRQQTTAHKYDGNLFKDARILGVRQSKLNETLNGKGGVASIARKLFLAMVDEKDRNVKCWDDLPTEVLLKEKQLITFMERFYGSLQVDPKKIHVSLVSCLRNQRSSKRKIDEESFTIQSNEKDSENRENDDDSSDDGRLIIDE